MSQSQTLTTATPAGSEILHRWTFRHQTDEGWRLMLDAIESARRSVCVEQFIVRPGQIADQLFARMKDRAAAGLDVRVLADRRGSRKLRRSPAVAELRKAGVRVVFYRPRTLSLLRMPPFLPYVLPRDHRKLVVVDDRQGFVGGLCFQDRMKYWRDTLLAIEGPVVKQMADAFDLSWNAATQRSATPVIENVPTADGFQYVANTRTAQSLSRLVVEALRRARSNVRMMSPYFLPYRRLEADIKAALERGVRVEIFIPARSDLPWLDPVSHKLAARLASHGAEVWLYGPTTLHAKVAVFDDIAMVGSLNFDRLSMRTNLENGVIVQNPSFVDEVNACLDADRELSTRLDAASWKTRPLADRFMGAAGVPLRSLM